MNPKEIIKSFIENQNSAFAPRLRYDSADDNTAFLKWKSDIELTIKEIRNNHQEKDIPAEVSLFGNSYLHDSEVHAISSSKNKVKISFLAAENWHFREVCG